MVLTVLGGEIQSIDKLLATIEAAVLLTTTVGPAIISVRVVDARHMQATAVRSWAARSHQPTLILTIMAENPRTQMATALDYRGNVARRDNTTSIVTSKDDWIRLGKLFEQDGGNLTDQDTNSDSLPTAPPE